MTKPSRFRSKVASKILIAAGLVCAGVMVDISIAARQTDQPATTQNEKKLAAGEREAKKLLLMMDADKNGKVSKQEYMNFMAAEFDRLDINKDGELDVKELTQSQVQVRTRAR